MYVKFLACAKGPIHGSDYFIIVVIAITQWPFFIVWEESECTTRKSLAIGAESQSELNALLLALPCLPVLTPSSPGVTLREKDEGQEEGRGQGAWQAASGDHQDDLPSWS